MRVARKVKLLVTLGLVLVLLLAGCARPAPAGPYGELRIAESTFQEETFTPFRNPNKVPTSPVIGTAATYRWAGWGAGDPNTGYNLMLPFHSNDLFGLLGKNAEVDKLLEDSQTEPDAKKRREMVEKVVKIGTDSYTAIGIASVPDYWGMGPRINLTPPKGVGNLGTVAEFVTHRK
ncbi:MAG: hypothetical protein HW402_893 [Dehalococcoidales bacterium]|nr:hypothetical protein [Dehalococcoidales bacterium]